MGKIERLYFFQDKIKNIRSKTIMKGNFPNLDFNIQIVNCPVNPKKSTNRDQYI